MAFSSRRPTKRTRTTHVCAGCCVSIPAGSAATRYSAADDSGINTYYLCSACEDYANKYDDYMDMDNTFMPGDILEARKERERWAKSEVP